MTEMTKNSNQISLYTNLTKVQKVESGLYKLTTFGQSIAQRLWLRIKSYKNQYENIVTRIGYKYPIGRQLCK